MLLIKNYVLIFLQYEIDLEHDLNILMIFGLILAHTMYCWLNLAVLLMTASVLQGLHDLSLLGLKLAFVRPAESLDEWVGDAPCICRAWCRSGRSCEPSASASGRSSCSTGGTGTPGCWCESERAASCWPAAWTHGHRYDTCAPSLPERRRNSAWETTTDCAQTYACAFSCVPVAQW